MSDPASAAGGGGGGAPKTRFTVLISNGVSDVIQASNQKSALRLLDDLALPYDVVDGMDPEQKERRNRFFGISGVRGNYPQIFSSDQEGDAHEYLGGSEWIQSVGFDELRAAIGKDAGGRVEEAAAEPAGGVAVSAGGSSPPIPANYGSCDQAVEGQNNQADTSDETTAFLEQKEIRDSTRNGRTRHSIHDIEGEKPHFVAVAITSVVLLAAISLFIVHIHHTSPPLGHSVVNIPGILNMNMAGSGGNANATDAIVPDPNAYPRRPFITKRGLNITIPVLGFPSVALAQYPDPNNQHLANEAVRHAVEDLKIGYFDVAPEYGDGVAQERLGPALEPYRKNVFLAAKTMYRDAEGSAADLANTLRALRTDHLDLYQFHSISTQADVDTILGPSGAMETFQKARREGKIKAMGFSAHSEDMAVRMIETGLVDTCMFPINFVAYHYGGVGQKVLDAAIQNNVGVIALKSGARGRLTPENGEAVHVPEAFEHIPEWKRQEMIDYPVVTSKVHHTWYEPEDDPVELNRLILWSLNRPGVTATLPPGSLGLLDGISDMLRGKSEVPEFDGKDVQHMLERYGDIVPIFHNRSVAGTKVST